MTFAPNKDIRTTNRLYVVHAKHLSADKAWYMELHGAKYIKTNGKLYFQKHKYRVTTDGVTTFFHRDCDYLVDGKCKGHPHDKPLVCQNFKENDPSTISSSAMITPNCLAKYKQVKR